MLISSIESPICMKFYVNLYGANDGQLRVLIQTNDSVKVKWIIPSGDDKQRWIQSQVLLSAGENFKVRCVLQIHTKVKSLYRRSILYSIVIHRHHVIHRYSLPF